MPTPEKDLFTAPDGEVLAFWRWPVKPGRPTLHWAHATGFHARAYAPLLDELSKAVNVVAWDMRGHGESWCAGNLNRFYGWGAYYRDLSALIDHLDEPLWLAGHSVGATASFAAASKNSGKVLGIFAVEPVLLDFRRCILLAVAKQLHQSHRFVLAKGALKRRAVYASREGVFEVYRQKASFKRWSDAWLWAYVNHGFLDEMAGGVRLACDPQWEALSFAKTEHRPLRQVRGIDEAISVYGLAAEHGSTFPRSARERVLRRLLHAEIEEVPGTSHFLPMENTDRVRQWMLSRIGF